MYYWKQNQCCNLTDHIGLPIIHIKAYIHNKYKRQEYRCRIQITLYYKGPYKHRTKPTSHLTQQPNIYDLQTVTNNYLSVHSIDMTLGG